MVETSARCTQTGFPSILAGDIGVPTQGPSLHRTQRRFLPRHSAESELSLPPADIRLARFAEAC